MISENPMSSTMMITMFGRGAGEALAPTRRAVTVEHIARPRTTTTAKSVFPGIIFISFVSPKFSFLNL
jgi:hypothetical protein